MRIFLLAALVFSLGHNSHAQAWELKKDTDSIKVFTREVNRSSIKEFKAIGNVAANSETILSILKDVPSYTQWIEDVKYTNTVSSSENHLSFYYQMNLPWPAKDRDLCLDMEITRLDKSITVMLTSNPDLVPMDKDFIRILLVEGQWVITALDEQNSEVEHQFLADPEGSLPAWIVNLFAVDSPHQTMKNLREYVKTK